MSKLTPGAVAPDFQLDDQAGETVSLADFRGKKLLVYFYPRADTPGCTKQSCSVRDAAAELAERGVAAVGISPDTSDTQRKFDTKYELGFPLLADTDHAAAEAYGAWGEKSMYGKKYFGIIRSAFLIDEQGRIAETWYKVRPADTVPKLLGALQS